MKLAPALALCAGCLGPQVSDDPAPSGDIVPAGTQVPSIDEDDEDAGLIAMHDGVDGVVPRLTAFAAGMPTHAWNFGPAPAIAAPMYWVMQRQADGSLTRIMEHPAIVHTIPGEPGYSPYWTIFELVVTDAYHGELITSSTAIEEAVRTGLVEAPTLRHAAVNWPLVASDVRLEVGTVPPLPPSGVVYYEHHTVPYFGFGLMPVTEEVQVIPDPHYVLRRDGQEPLSEPIRGIDIDGDGDIVDSNDIYVHAAGDPARSPLCRRVDVAVVSTTVSIDTTNDDASAAIKSATQLFAPGPVPGTVVAFDETDELSNCPQQKTVNGP